ncbi:centrosomal protein of 89 kDa [Harpegnathos saltator]|uniref:Coiled-coil domain-containing protein 123, mitochondrial n=1 Tax=Harpegnathos saltator TaxID=610380 RepID=E2C0E8_HARSA|nr:centrosomal protein of 89 kDa [Harpegnathos saltator]EFN78607.1 Coiled-coil domain-containing protein 123, mitochondrial [Harpegnathos saltator]
MPNRDNSADKHVKGKSSSSHRTLNAENEPEPVHKPLHRHRRVHKVKHHSRNNDAHGELIGRNGNGDSAVSSKKNNKQRCIQKEIDKLVEESQILTMRLEGSNIDSKTLAELKEKDFLMSRICNKYHKLLKDREELQQECDKLNALLAEHEVEYRQLHVHHKEFIEALQKAEKTKVNLLTFNERFKAENVQLNEDVLLLKNVIYRLNAELGRYQDKMRELGQSIAMKNINDTLDSKAQTNDIKKILESWGSVNTHVLGPLLDAYQESLSEKQELINKYEEDMANFSARCKEIIAENETMQSEMEKLRSKCTRYTDEIKMISEDADLLKELNECYAKQTAHQKQKIHEIHSLYEQKVEVMSFDNNRLHEECLAFNTELSNLQGKYHVLQKEYEKLQSDNRKTMPIGIHNAAVEECKELFEKLKHQYETEKDKQSARIKELEEAHCQNKTQLDVVTIERNQLKASNKNLEKNLRRVQRKLEHFQKIAHSVQVSRDSFKKQLRKTAMYCEELFSEYERTLSERDKLVSLLHETENENASIHFLGDTITQRVGDLKKQLKVVHEGAKQQLEMTEKSMKVQQLGVHRMKDEYHRELQRLKHLVRKKEEVIGRLQKEISATRENLELIWKATATDQKKVKGALKNAKIQYV